MARAFGHVTKPDNILSLIPAVTGAEAKQADQNKGKERGGPGRRGSKYSDMLPSG